MMVNVGVLFGCTHDKCIYNKLCLPGVVIHFEYNKRESANIMQMLFSQNYE